MLEEEIRKVSEPAKLAAQYLRLKRSLETTTTKVENVLSKFTLESIKKMGDVFAEAEGLRARRRRWPLSAASMRITLGDSLATDAWRKLYESAEAFNAIAYPGEEFPSDRLGGGSACCVSLIFRRAFFRSTC